jgi:D-alanyl-D-alanine carboxypeptidase (penicillin-binding protein 5/6)
VEQPLDRAAEIRRRHSAAAARRRARQRRGALAGLSLVTVVALLVVVFGASAPTPYAVALHTQSPLLEPPRLVASPALSPTVERRSPLLKLPFPAKGEGALAAMGSGVLAASPRERPVPIASMTKMMTAYLTLEAHPLAGQQQGPTEHFTAADHTAWMRYSSHDLSNVELVAGERLTERQLLEALLLPSADNVADWLARWVAGSKARFVALMNTTAEKLGMTSTHYADASGVNPKTVSTAADQTVIAAMDMENPVFRAIVAMPDAPFPVEGTIWNVNPALGVDGIVGVKSGFTGQAAGCLTTAAWRSAGPRRVLLIAIVTGQPDGLWQAATADEALLQAASPALRLDTATAGASLSVPWMHKSVPTELGAPLQFVTIGGAAVKASLSGALVTASNLVHGWAAGAVVGELVLSSRYGVVLDLPVTLRSAVPPPPQGFTRPQSSLSIAVSPR